MTGANKSASIIKDMKVKSIITENSTPSQKITNDLSVDDERQIKIIKDLMREKLSAGKGIDDDVKQEVMKLYETIGDVRAVSIVLGLSERMVSNWVDEK